VAEAAKRRLHSFFLDQSGFALWPEAVLVWNYVSNWVLGDRLGCWSGRWVLGWVSAATHSPQPIRAAQPRPFDAVSVLIGPAVLRPEAALVAEY